jgi:succinate dehydrogenase / fumarate reductase cytochrome b subunit
MINAIRVGYSVLRYRGGIGQWAWAVNRAAGLGILLFLALHIADIFVVGFGPGLFNELLFLYKGPAVRILDIFLVFGLLYHGLNGLRLTLMDFKPSTARYHLQLFYAQIVLFLLLFIPASLAMLNEFYGIVGGGAITVAILALPLVVAAASHYLPFGVENVEVSGGNYAQAIERVAGSRGRPHNAFEFNMWLFMRVSGLLIIFLAFIHMFLMHFMISVEQITFDTIVARWTGAQGAFWRTFDLLLLAFAFTHGMNGARNVLEDYFHSPAWRAFLKIGLWLFWFVLIGMGAFIIFTFTPGTLK